MKFGYYSQVTDPDNTSVYADLLDELREQVVVCEQVGFDIAWADEHHFNFGHTTLPNPIVAGAMLAAHTSRIRIGLPVVPANWHPLRLAEDVALLDHLSKGRVEVSMGRGAERHSIGNLNPQVTDLYPDQSGSFDASKQTPSREHFAEVIEIMKKAWTQDSFSHEGQFYQFPQSGLPWEYTASPSDATWVRDGEIVKMCMGPKPYQQPYPPLRMLMHSEPSYAEGARLGLMGWTWVNPLERMRQRMEEYSAIRTELEGRQFRVGEDMAVLRLLYVAPTYEEAKREADAFLTPLLRYICEGKPKSYYLDEDEEETTDLDLDWEFWRKRLILLAGSPEQVAEQLYELDERCSIDTIALLTQTLSLGSGAGVLSHKQTMASLELFGSKVAPLFANGR